MIDGKFTKEERAYLISLDALDEFLVDRHAWKRKEALSTSLLRATCLKKFSYFCQIGTLVADRDKDVRGLLAGIFDTNKKTLRQALHTR